MTTTLAPPDGGVSAISGAIDWAAGAGGKPTQQVWAIRSTGLSKAYGARRAVDGLDLAVPAGSITGFVGPNGSGKTTTIRMLLGLVRPTAGTGEVLGIDLRRPTGYLARVGALIEGPAFHPGLSGRRNLEVQATLGGIGRRRIDEVLDIVALHDRAGDRFGSYSLGMKQRLGVAAALLVEPRLLILDEPTNGLDRGGIIDTRHLMLGLREAGVTVFVSSHLLAELEQVADWIVLLDSGRLLFQGPMAELLARRRTSLVAAAAGLGDLEVVAAVARRLGHDAEVLGGRVHIDATPEDGAAINRAAMQAGVALSVQRSALEDTFLTLTGGR